jgi:hypothetical protein
LGLAARHIRCIVEDQGLRLSARKSAKERQQRGRGKEGFPGSFVVFHDIAERSTDQARADDLAERTASNHSDTGSKRGACEGAFLPAARCLVAPA